MSASGNPTHLHEQIAARVKRWREAGYSADQSTIAEIFEFATDETATLRYLRRPQLQALETYWYLRLVEGTPWVFDLFAIPGARTQHEKTIRKPCAGNLHARFERGIQEPEPAWAPRLTSTNAGGGGASHAEGESLV